MALYLLIATLLASVALMARLAYRAIGEEYLLVLRVRGLGPWFFERSEDGRYARLPLGALPAALVRYAWRTWTPRPMRVRVTPVRPANDAA